MNAEIEIVCDECGLELEIKNENKELYEDKIQFFVKPCKKCLENSEDKVIAVMRQLSQLNY